MNRRNLLGALTAAGASIASGEIVASPLGNMFRIAVLLPMPPEDVEFKTSAEIFDTSLSSLGLKNDRDVKLMFESVGYESAEVRRRLAEIMLFRPNMIVCRSSVVTNVVIQEIKSIPIVFIQGTTDPITLRIVEEMRHPGGNITGFTNNEPSMGGKWMQILSEIAPQIARVAYLSNLEVDPISNQIQDSIQKKAAEKGIEVVETKMKMSNEIRPFYEKIALERNMGVIVCPSAFTLVKRKEITGLAAQFRIPSVYPFRYFVQAGGLASYGPEVHDIFKPAANYVEKIMRGTKAGDLPLQGPTKLNFVISLSAAEAIGLKFSPLVLAQADEILD